MVARIKTGKNLKGAVNYNERKIINGSAQIILASGYSKEFDKLGFSEKINRLQQLADLNTRVGTHCLHLSLNFDPSERLKVETLCQIAKEYMEGIGFGSQPFLVYEHFDAAHPHLHIVTTNIDRYGKRISMHNLGKGKSETSRKAIEIKFGLLKAGGKINLEQFRPRPIVIEKATYGKSETKRAISNIVIGIVEQYKFASLAELNAVLKQFNVVAERGNENSRMFQKGGLQYSIIDKSGKAIGVPIKASAIYGRPTLAVLERRYNANRLSRQPFKSRLIGCIEKSLADSNDTKTFAAQLEKDDVRVVYRTNTVGFVYGITYVDHFTKSVFNGSELGKAFSAAAIMAKFELKQEVRMTARMRGNTVVNEKSNGKVLTVYMSGQNKNPKAKKYISPFIAPLFSWYEKASLTNTGSLDIMGALLQPTGTIEWLPIALRRRSKKKRKKKNI